MSWVTVVWSVVASACLTLAAMHSLVWYKQRKAWASLAFSVTAVATAGMAACELWMMRAETPAEFGMALRWLHVPGTAVAIALVVFVRLHLRAGRPWLAWTTCALRALALLLNFILTPNLNYREITRLRQIPFLGESVSVGEGVPNPWMLVGNLSLVLLVIFVVDAAITVWRRGDRRRALVTGGSVLFFALAVIAQVVLVFWQVVHWPITLSLFFMGIVVAMGFEMSRDVLRSAQLSDELRESEERMTLAAEAAGFGVWSWNIPRDQVWGSERWLHLFGFAPDAAIRYERVIERVHPDDREMVERAVRYAVEDGVAYAEEFRVALPDGTQRWIAGRGRVVPDPDGKPGKMLGAAIDITARRQAEAEALRQRTELAHLSRVTMLGELSGSMAHELNQPLTAILSNAQAAQRFLAQDPVDLDEVRDIVTDIVEQDNRAGEVISRLRLLLKKGEVQRLPLDVNEVVQDVLELVRSDFVNQGVAAHTELAPALPMVSGDRVQLQQVVLNLLMNACDAMNGNPPADRRVVVRTELSGGEGVRVSVADRGAGIAAGELEQVFEPFFTSKTDGLGLGLSVCRSILTAHGGMLWAANNPERGATFHFTLPVDTGASP